MKVVKRIDSRSFPEEKVRSDKNLVLKQAPPELLPRVRERAQAFVSPGFLEFRARLFGTSPSWTPEGSIPTLTASIQ